MESKSELSTEIWMMICEELSLVSIPSLAQLSCVSWKFHKLANPLIYQEIHLHPDKKSGIIHKLLNAAALKVGKYTQNLIIDSEFEFVEEAGQLIGSCHALKSVKWSIEDWVTYIGVDMVLPMEIQEAIDQTDPKVGLHVNLVCDQPDYSNIITRDLSSSRLLSFTCRIHSSKVHMTDARTMQDLGGLLASATRLGSLCLDVKRIKDQRATGTWTFPRNIGKLPPVIELQLERYDWPTVINGRNHFNDTWDFSNLKDLRLTNVNLDNFFDSVPFHTLANLLNLKITNIKDRCTKPPNLSVQTKLWSNFDQLQSLSITTSWKRYITMAAFEHIGLRLKHLDLGAHDYTHMDVVWTEQDEISVEELEVLNKCCPYLETLTIFTDLRKKTQDTNDIIGPLCKFSRLRNFRIQSSSHLFLDGIEPTTRETDENVGIDSRRDSYVEAIFDFLVQNKNGCRFDRILIETLSRTLLPEESNWIYFCDVLNGLWGSTSRERASDEVNVYRTPGPADFIIMTGRVDEGTGRPKLKLKGISYRIKKIWV